MLKGALTNGNVLFFVEAKFGELASKKIYALTYTYALNQ